MQDVFQMLANFMQKIGACILYINKAVDILETNCLVDKCGIVL